MSHFSLEQVSQLWLCCHSVLHCRGCSVLCRVFTDPWPLSGMPVALPQWWQPRMSLDCVNILWGQNHPDWEHILWSCLSECRECVFTMLVGYSWEESSRNQSSWGTCNPGSPSCCLLPVTTDLGALGSRDGVHPVQSQSPRAYWLALLFRSYIRAEKRW